MSGIVPKPCEIIVSNDIQLSKDESNDSFIRFSTEEEFGILLLKYDSSKLILACTEDTLNGIAPRLNNPNLDIIYVLTQKKEIPVPLEVIQNNCQLIEIRSKKELIRNLFTKSMLYYFDQGLKHSISDSIANATSMYLDACNDGNNKLADEMRDTIKNMITEQIYEPQPPVPDTNNSGTSQQPSDQ